MLCVVASLIRRISFENSDYFGKPILGEMRLCSRFIQKFSDRVLVNLESMTRGADLSAPLLMTEG